MAKQSRRRPGAWERCDVQAAWEKHQAQQAPVNGGIDFDSKYLQMNIQGDGAMAIPIPKGFEWLENQPISGFTPKILEIQSGTMQTLPFFQGIAQ